MDNSAYYRLLVKVGKASHHPVARGGLAEPCGTQLGRPLLCLEVHVHQPEAVAEPGVPLEAVHRAPLEVALHGHTVGGRPLKLR